MLVVRKIRDIEVTGTLEGYRGNPVTNAIVVNNYPCLEFLCVSRLGDIIICTGITYLLCNTMSGAHISLGLTRSFSTPP